MSSSIPRLMAATKRRCSAKATPSARQEMDSAVLEKEASQPEIPTPNAVLRAMVVGVEKSAQRVKLRTV